MFKLHSIIFMKSRICISKQLISVTHLFFKLCYCRVGPTKMVRYPIASYFKTFNRIYNLLSESQAKASKTSPSTQPHSLVQLVVKLVTKKYEVKLTMENSTFPPKISYIPFSLSLSVSDKKHFYHKSILHKSSNYTLSNTKRFKGKISQMLVQH